MLSERVASFNQARSGTAGTALTSAWTSVVKMCLETLLLLSTCSEHKLLTRPEQSSPIRDVWGWLGAATSPEFVSQLRNQRHAHPPGTTKQPVPSPRMESSDWKRSEAQDGDL